MKKLVGQFFFIERFCWIVQQNLIIFTSRFGNKARFIQMITQLNGGVLPKDAPLTVRIFMSLHA